MAHCNRWFLCLNMSDGIRQIKLEIFYFSDIKFRYLVELTTTLFPWSGSFHNIFPILTNFPVIIRVLKILMKCLKLNNFLSTFAENKDAGNSIEKLCVQEVVIV